MYDAFTRLFPATAVVVSRNYYRHCELHYIYAENTNIIIITAVRRREEKKAREVNLLGRIMKKQNRTKRNEKK